MAHFSDVIKSPAFAEATAMHLVRNRISGAMSKLKASGTRKTDIAYLSEYTDAELADIGLLRSELSESMFEDAIDAQAQAMLRVYR